MSAAAIELDTSSSGVLDGVAGILSRAEVAVWGAGPSAPMENERPGHRPSDVLFGARCIICFGIPVPRGVFEQREHAVETTWRVQGLYYRRLDDLSVRIAAQLEEAGERAVPIFGCLPVVLRGSSSIAGYVNQIRMGEVTRIGTRGRNGLLFHPRYGSRLMLGGVVTTATLPARTEPQAVEAVCPVNCRRCVDACPIQAVRPEQRVVGDECLRFTSRTPLLPKLRYLLLSRFRPRKAARLLSTTSLDEHTLHVCSRCACACPAEAGAGVAASTRCDGGVTRPGPTPFAEGATSPSPAAETSLMTAASRTNGHARPASAPLLLRLGFAAAGAVAPSLAARAAERLFLMPPRHRPSRREREAIAGGNPFAVAVKGETVRAWRFGAGPPVLLVHGWGGRGGQLAAFIAPLLSAGCSAVAFDAPAHGRSTGHLASGITFAEAVSAVAASVGARAAIGHSMGATAVGWAAAHGLRLDAAVLLGPPRGAAAFFQQFCDALVLDQPVREALRFRIERRYGIAPEEFDLAAVVSTASTPLLVFHDRGDREVPWTDGTAIARAWPGAALVSTDGLGHRGILRDPDVAARAAAFLLDYMPRCACGRLASEPVGSRIWCGGCALERELYDR